MWFAIFKMRDMEYFNNIDEIILPGDYDTIVIDKQSIKTIGLDGKYMVFAVAAQLFHMRGYNPVNYAGFIGMFKS